MRKNQKKTRERQVELHLLMPTLLVVPMLAAAFSTGSPLFLMLGLLIALLCGTGIYGVLRAADTLEVSETVSEQTVQRGEDVLLTVTVRHRGRIPIAPLDAELSSVGGEVQETMLDGGRQQVLQVPFHAAHVGAGHPGVERVRISDLLGVCCASVRPNASGTELLVLPQLFDIAPLKLSSGDAGAEAMARASEDVTNPAEVRTYQPGDPIKKIHWKLSARKREPLVRRFEDPVQPDALALMDCSAPPRQADAEQEADLRDALLETAASVMVQAERAEHPARLPIFGLHPVELDKEMGLPILLENLARTDFSDTEPFAKVLLLETRRMRRVGCTVVITARLDSQMVDVMISMRRMGPNVRLYLVTQTPDDPLLQPLITSLQENSVEVGYVRPLPM